MAFSLSHVQDPCGNFIAVHVGDEHVLSIVDDEDGEFLALTTPDGDFPFVLGCLSACLDGIEEALESLGH